MKDAVNIIIFAIAFVSSMVSLFLWVTDRMDEKTMIGLTLVLSWAAIWYSAYIAIIA